MNKALIPQQQRSIEKKEKIIEAGIQLMKEKGYYHVTTTEITNLAGVSTGICYRYFNNKLDILTAALTSIIDNTFHPLTEQLINMPSPISVQTFTNFIKVLLDQLCTMHESLGILHNDLEALQHSEPVIAKFLYEIEAKLLMQFSEIFTKSEVEIQHPNEKIYITYNLIEGFCHKKIFHHTNSVDLNILYTETINTIIFLIFSDRGRIP